MPKKSNPTCHGQWDGHKFLNGNCTQCGVASPLAHALAQAWPGPGRSEKPNFEAKIDEIVRLVKDLHIESKRTFVREYWYVRLPNRAGTELFLVWVDGRYKWSRSRSPKQFHASVDAYLAREQVLSTISKVVHVTVWKKEKSS